MVSPRPVPPNCRVVEPSAWVNGSKMASRRSGGMPMPVSRTTPCSATSPACSHSFSISSTTWPRLGELDRVAQQVDQDLPQPAVVAHDVVGHVRRHAVRQLEPLRVGGDAHAARGLRHQLAQAERARLQLQAAGLDLREVEDAVDHREQALGGVADHQQVVALHPRQRRGQQQLGDPDDAVHRGADLVAHVGQELALGAVRPLGDLRRRLLVLDVRAGAVPLRDLAARIADGQGAHEVPAVLAVGGAPEAELALVAHARSRRRPSTRPGSPRGRRGASPPPAGAPRARSGDSARVLDPALVEVVDPALGGAPTRRSGAWRRRAGASVSR